MHKNSILKITFVLLLSLIILAAGLFMFKTAGNDQSLSIAEAITQDEGEVTTGGVVTATLKNTIQIQDDTGAIAVRPASLDVQMGDDVTITGKLDSFNGLRQLQEAVIEEQSSKAEVPDPVSIDGHLLEDHQSELAVIENITLINVDKGDDWANYAAEDDQGNRFIIRDDNDSLNLKKDAHYDNIIGVVSRFKDTQQLIPRAQADISMDQSAEDSEKGTNIHHIQGEGHESPMSGDVVEKVKGIVTYTYELNNSHYFHIQNPESKYDGNPDTSEGIVVYTGRQENISVGDLVAVTGEVDEYFIDGYNDKQETDLPVTQINAREDMGGNISIHDSHMELPPPVKITSSDIPEDIITEAGFDTFEVENAAIDFWESIEGMRVEIAPSQALAPQEHGDLVVATEELEPEHPTVNGGIRQTEEGINTQSIQLKLFPDGNAEDFTVKTGDTFTEPIAGVVNYGYGHYKVYADLPDVEDVFEKKQPQQRETEIVEDDAKLTVASYNVENFSANPSETSDKKAANIAEALVEEMGSPDIIGLVEMMDNNGQNEGPFDADASKSYERLISEINDKGGPTYSYAHINPEYNQDGGVTGGNIQTGFLYNPNRVSMTKGKHGTATDSVMYKDEKLTLNPGRIVPNHKAFNNTRKPLAAQFEFQGESVVIIANHLYAKLGDDPLYGQNQPPELASKSRRIEAAKQVNDFVQEIKQDSPSENVVVLGDMNDYEYSETLNVLKGSELTNMVEKVPAKERYSFVYQGSSQVLDHILVSNHLADATEIDIIHVNADFTDMHGRASDHDPVLSQMDLRAIQ